MLAKSDGSCGSDLEADDVSAEEALSQYDTEQEIREVRINENNQENLLPTARSLPTLPTRRPSNCNPDCHRNLHNHRDNHQCPSGKWKHSHHSEPHDQHNRRYLWVIVGY